MSSNETSPRSLSKVYHVLCADRRRDVIRLFIETDKAELSVRTLAKEIAAKEENVRTGQATGEPYRNVYNALSQTHLSTLSDAGIIIYDSNRQLVSPGPNFQMGALFTVLNNSAYQILQKIRSVPEAE